MKYLLTIVPILAILTAPAAAEFRCLELDADSSCILKWAGGSGTLQVEDGANAFNGSPTVTLEWKSRSAADYEQIDALGCTFTAAGKCNFSVGRGDLKVRVTGGTGVDIVSAFVTQEHKAALTSSVSSSGLVTGNLTMSDDATIGLLAGGHIKFDAQSPDEISFLDVNVGIGTSNPLTTLDVAGSSRITAAATSVLTGMIDPTASTAVIGTGTLFTAELIVGDRITVNGETRRVTAILDNLHLTVANAFTDNANDTSPDRLPVKFVLVDTAGDVDFAVTDAGLFVFPLGASLIAGAAESITLRSSDQLAAFKGNVGDSPPATCEVGSLWMDTDEKADDNCVTTLDNSICCCNETDTWTVCGEPPAVGGRGELYLKEIGGGTDDHSFSGTSFEKITSFNTAGITAGIVSGSVANSELTVSFPARCQCFLHGSFSGSNNKTVECCLFSGADTAEVESHLCLARKIGAGGDVADAGSRVGGLSFSADDRLEMRCRADAATTIDFWHLSFGVICNQKPLN